MDQTIDRIALEAGTSLIKERDLKGFREVVGTLRQYGFSPYITGDAVENAKKGMARQYGDIDLVVPGDQGLDSAYESPPEHTRDRIILSIHAQSNGMKGYGDITDLFPNASKIASDQAGWYANTLTENRFRIEYDTTAIDLCFESRQTLPDDAEALKDTKSFANRPYNVTDPFEGIGLRLYGLRE